MIKDIAVVCNSSDAEANCFPAARALADRHAARVCGLCLTADLLPSMAVAASAHGGAVIAPDVGIYEEQQERLNRSSRHLAEAFRAAFAGLPTGWDWLEIRAEQGGLGTLAGAHARMHDLIMVSAGSDDTAGWHATIEDIVVEGGRPVIICPVTGETRLSAPPATVVVAWDGSKEAARAVHEALPFLYRAKSVVAVTVDADAEEDDQPTGLEALRRHLDVHGIRIAERRPAADGASTSDVLCREARAVGAEMIVMGAFGGSWLREALFGSSTDAMINSAGCPLLLAH